MYNTKQKKQLADFFKNNTSKQLSVNEIVMGICPNGSGKSTVYRLISKMVEDGTLIRLRGDDGKSILYQYAGEETGCAEHFHLKCTECGKLIHLDCKHIDHLRQHIQLEHEFSIDMISTVIYGTCKDCREK
jgi:Fur family ferric uptake transcriptional regulator